MAGEVWVAVLGGALGGSIVTGLVNSATARTGWRREDRFRFLDRQLDAYVEAVSSVAELAEREKSLRRATNQNRSVLDQMMPGTLDDRHIDLVIRADRRAWDERVRFDAAAKEMRKAVNDVAAVGSSEANALLLQMLVTFRDEAKRNELTGSLVQVARYDIYVERLTRRRRWKFRKATATPQQAELARALARLADAGREEADEPDDVVDEPPSTGGGSSTA